MRRSRANQSNARLRKTASVFSSLLLSALLFWSPRAAEAQTWTGSTSDQWSNAANWSPGTVPDSSTAAVIISNATNNPVILTNFSNPTVGTLSIGSGNSLNVDNGVSLYVAGGSISNAGQINLGMSSSANLYFESNTTLLGSGTVNLNNANSVLGAYGLGGTGTTLTNQSTIAGLGTISYVNLANQGTVNANVSGGKLYLYQATATNTGTLQASGGGTFEVLTATVNNAGGTISTDGSSSVILNNALITGGNLTTTGGGVIHGQNGTTIGGVTITSGSTYSVDPGNTNYLSSSITNNGSLLIGSSSGGASLYVTNPLTIAGSGTVTLNNADATLATNYLATLTNQSTIAGQGAIGGFLNNQGTINANVSGGTLSLGSSATNTGTLEATGGGTLGIYNSTVNNTGSAISAAGPSSQVTITNSTITGGNLTTTGGGVIHGQNGATIGGVTITAGSTYSVDAGNANYLSSGITNNGSLLVGGSGGGAGLYLRAPLTIAGSGALTLNNAGSVLGAYELGGTSTTLTNQTTIAGQGTISYVNLANQGTVNANVSGGMLYLYEATAANTGTLQATGGGTFGVLNSTVNNAGGTISTDGSSSVILNNALITGGNLTTTGGGVIHGQNSTTIGGVTITSGSTYSVDPGNANYLSSGITNNGSLLIGSSGGGAGLYLEAPLTIAGSGTLTLNNANSELSGASLTNQSTIAGQGHISDSLNNQGTVDANVAGRTLYVQSGITVNSGVFRADAGATLDLSGSTLSNFSSSGLSAGTLIGGTYEVYGGTLKFNNGGFANDLEINAATIVLDGSTGTPKMLDQNGNNALANFGVNATSGKFTIQNGVNLTTPGFTNAGTVNIGANSTLTVGGAADYVQSNAGTTTLLTSSSVLALAPGHSFDLNFSVLQGIGTLDGNLITSGGEVRPGSAGSIGTLTITGDMYGVGEVLAINIDSGGSSLLDLGGSAFLAFTELDVRLLDGFMPTNGSMYEIMETGGVSGMFTDPVIHEGNLTFTTDIVGNDVFLDVTSNVIATPEPSSLVMLASGLMVVATTLATQRSRSRTRQQTAV